MSELGQTERRLLRAIHSADQPTAEDRARIRAGVAARIGIASGAAAAIAAVASSANGLNAAAGMTSAVAGGAGVGSATTFAGLIGGSWKIGVVAVALASTAGGTAWMLARAPNVEDSERIVRLPVERAVGERPAPALGAAKSVPAMRDTGMSSVERGEVSQRTRERERSQVPARSGSGASSPPGKSSDLEAELQLLGEAQRALKDGNSAQALTVLEQHAVEHPNGALSKERAAVRAVALCTSGRMAEGARDARRFLAENPKSPMAIRVRGACFSRNK